MKNGSAYYLLICYLMMAKTAFAQADCETAVPFCPVDTSFNYDVHGIGIGLDGAEHRWGCTAENITTIWSSMDVVQSGTFEFIIDPDEVPIGYADYDFLIVDMTAWSCDSVTTAPIVACGGSIAMGAGGDSATTGAVDSLFVMDTIFRYFPTVHLDSGHLYYWQITNVLISEINFQLTTNGTVGFASTKPAILETYIDSCDRMDQIHIRLNTPMRCKSLRADGSQFDLLDAAAPDVLSAEWLDCSAGFAQELLLHLSAPLSHEDMLLLHYSDSLPLRNECGYNLQDTTLIISGDLFFAHFYISDTLLCEGEAIQIQNHTIQADSTRYEYETGIFVSDTIHTYITSGIYEVGIYSYHCDSIYKEHHTITVLPKPSIGALPSDTTLCAGGHILLQVDLTGASSCVWSDGTMGDTWAGDIAQGNTLSLDYELSNPACESMHSITIHTGCGIFFPNTFSPNDDGENDIWTPVNLGVEIEVIRIYNRWGEKVYEAYGNAVAWTGTEAQQGTYIYHCQYKDENTTQTTSGNIILLR